MLGLAVDRFPIVRKPGGGILKADEDEELEAELLGLGDHVIGFAPIENARRLFDFIPNKLSAHRIGVDFLEFDEVVFELLEGLVRSDGWIPGLIRNSVRDEVLERVRVPEIAVAHLQNAAFRVCSSGSEPNRDEGCEEKSSSDEGAARVVHSTLIHGPA